MISNGLSSLRPEGIERGPDYHTLKDEIFHQIWVNCLPLNVIAIALTVRALKGGTKVPWPSSLTSAKVGPLKSQGILTSNRSRGCVVKHEAH